MMVTVVTAVIVIPVMLMTFIVEDFAGRAVDLVFIFMLGRAKFKFVAVYTVVAVLLGGGEDYIRGGKPAVLKCDKLCIQLQYLCRYLPGRHFPFFFRILF
mgnify:CR=1 FL=1